MNPNDQPKRRDNVLSSLNMAIDAMNTAAEDVPNVASAKAAFGSVSVILTMIRVSSLPTHHVGRLLANVRRTR